LSQIPSTVDLASLRLEVHNEFPFAVREERGLINGSFDRLILILDSERVIAAEVLDYKTDTWAINSPEVEVEKVDFYRPQIDAYRRVVTIMTGLEPEQIACRLLFVCQGKEVVL
jgi:ATP-dependent exoDNAse (exonuclease V) beta subunit